MDSLQDILGKKNFTPPDEIAVIKDYIKRRYHSRSRVKIEKSAIIVSVPSSALAATIYLERQTLIEHCGLKQRLVIRTGR
jgi:predicted ATP-dependent Lon-type protease